MASSGDANEGLKVSPLPFPFSWERLLRFVVPGISAIYISGFLVSVLHFAQYGVVSHDLLRAQYFLAGAWLLLPIVWLSAIGSMLQMGWLDGSEPLFATWDPDTHRGSSGFHPAPALLIFYIQMI